MDGPGSDGKILVQSASKIINSEPLYCATDLWQGIIEMAKIHYPV